MADNRTLVNRLLRSWEASGGPTTWYQESRMAARRLARDYSVSEAVAAGVIAALSPRQFWHVNLRLAEQVLRGDVEIKGCFATNLDKARRIAEGERPLNVLRGPKVTAFYRAIRGDSEAVVIDVWVAKAMGVDVKDIATDYERLATAIRRAASRAGVSPSTLQAAVWIHTRGRSG